MKRLDLSNFLDWCYWFEFEDLRCLMIEKQWEQDSEKKEDRYEKGKKEGEEYENF